MNVKFRLWQYAISDEMAVKMLDQAGYFGEKILGKKVINLCSGYGTILKHIYFRYINQYYRKNGNLNGIEKELTSLIVGVEIDKLLCHQSIFDLSFYLLNFGLNVNPSVINFDALRLGDLFSCQTNAANIKVKLPHFPEVLDNFKLDGFDFCFCVPPQELRIEPSNFKMRVLNRYKPDDFFYDYYLNFIQIGLKLVKDSGKVAAICSADFWFNGEIDGFSHKLTKLVESADLIFKSQELNYSGLMGLFVFGKRGNNGCVKFKTEVEENFLTLPLAKLPEQILGGYIEFLFRLSINFASNFDIMCIKQTKECKNPIYYLTQDGQILVAKNYSNKPANAEIIIESNLSSKQLNYLTRNKIFSQMLNCCLFKEKSESQQFKIINNFLSFNLMK